MQALMDSKVSYYTGGGVILPFLELAPETLKTTIDRNLWTAVWSVIKHLPYMLEAGYGLWDHHVAYNAANGGSNILYIL